MPTLVSKLLQLYTPLVGLVLIGFILGGKLPKVFPAYLGQFLFWVGVPISIVAFLHRADLSGPIWLAPLVAWVAIFLGLGLANAWMNWQAYLQKTEPQAFWSQPSQGSFLLAAMVGNTGYLGYPVVLAVVGTKFFAWALFYDLLGTTLGAYGLGVAIAARFSRGAQSPWRLVQAISINPALWSFGFGLGFRQIQLPTLAEQSLQGLAWTSVALSLVLVGMRLSQLNSWHKLPQAGVSLGIKMFLIPLLLGSSLSLFGLKGSAQLVIVLQMAMPPAFATLVIAEAFQLDLELTVTALVLGSAGLLVMLPVWLWLFG
ncbi:MAG: AEC family transporter [Chroococcidiopsidaceae cyanobacterium CP_BM_RX_35]|nr:AEC family transporter [Chroococcidiopsidaceae cyanobacterium CP_BM_RX_35]